MGRPKGINFSVRKNIKITEDQNKNWKKNTSKLIRDLLEGKLVSIELLKQLYDFLSNKCEVREIEDSDIVLLETIKGMVK